MSIQIGPDGAYLNSRNSHATRIGRLGVIAGGSIGFVTLKSYAMSRRHLFATAGDKYLSPHRVIQTATNGSWSGVPFLRFPLCQIIVTFFSLFCSSVGLHSFLQLYVELSYCSPCSCCLPMIRL